MKYIVRVGGVVATLAFIWTGFLFVQARGNPGGIETAKKVLLNTAIGTAILLGAQILATIIEGTVRSITR